MGFGWRDAAAIGLNPIVGGQVVGGKLAGLLPDDILENPLGSRTDNEFRQVDPNGNIAREAGRASEFARLGEQGFIATGDRMRGTLNDMVAGNNLVSTEQLRQGLQQNLAQQQAMAASAAPQNAAMAARNASMNAANIGAGMSGQAAMMGLQERNAALGQLGQLRGQDLQAALGSRGQALGGYGTIEAQRGARFGALANVPTQQEILFGGLTSMLPMAFGGPPGAGGAAKAGGGGSNLLHESRHY